MALLKYGFVIEQLKHPCLPCEFAKPIGDIIKKYPEQCD